MLRTFFANIVSRKADKFIIGALGMAASWTATHGVPLDSILSDGWMAAISNGATAILIYAIRNKF